MAAWPISVQLTALIRPSHWFCPRPSPVEMHICICGQWWSSESTPRVEHSTREKNSWQCVFSANAKRSTSAGLRVQSLFSGDCPLPRQHFHPAIQMAGNVGILVSLSSGHELIRPWWFIFATTAMFLKQMRMTRYDVRPSDSWVSRSNSSLLWLLCVYIPSPMTPRSYRAVHHQRYIASRHSQITRTCIIPEFQA